MITWEQRIRLISAIVQKDLRISPWIWIALVVIAGAGFSLLLPAALSSARFARTPWAWYDSNLRPFYAISVFLSTLCLSITFASFHGGEIRRGTIRSIIVYPVDMNDITIAKLVSSFIITAILTSVIFFGLFGPFFLVGLFPFGDFLAIHATALAMSFVVLAVGAFLAQWLAQFAGRMMISPAALGAILLLFAILFTETALTFIGDQIAYMMAEIDDRTLTPDDFAQIREAARALSVLSPFHAGGRILAVSFGIVEMWVDLHVVIPITAIAVAGGYLFGKKLYLDVFIR